jgi:hypothetical protein
LAFGAAAGVGWGVGFCVATAGFGALAAACVALLATEVVCLTVLVPPGASAGFVALFAGGAALLTAETACFGALLGAGAGFVVLGAGAAGVDSLLAIGAAFAVAGATACFCFGAFAAAGFGALLVANVGHSSREVYVYGAGLRSSVEDTRLGSALAVFLGG